MIFIFFCGKSAVILRYLSHRARESLQKLVNFRANAILASARESLSRILYPKVGVFSQFQVHLNTTQATTNNKFITSSSVNFYPIITDIIDTSSKENESDELLCTVRSLVMVRARGLTRSLARRRAEQFDRSPSRIVGFRYFHSSLLSCRKKGHRLLKFTARR